MGWWLSVPRFGVSWFFRLHVEASAHGSSGPPVLPVGSLVLWSSWLIGCGHRIIRSIAAKKNDDFCTVLVVFHAPNIEEGGAGERQRKQLISKTLFF